MIPFRDDNPTRRFPLVVVALIAANIAVFVYQFGLSVPEERLFVYTHGAIPAVLIGGADLTQVMPQALRSWAMQYGIPITPLQPIWLTVFTSMFLHAGVLHLGFNMLYLWVFGNNVEDLLGRFRFLVFYLLCGAVAAGAQVMLGPRSPIPMVGASGAIAGVLGAYYLKFPHARVYCLIFFFIITVAAVPAGLVLLLWFLLQVLSSLSAGGALAGQGGVAFFAHIGGFLAGLVLIRRFEPRPRFRRSG